MLPSQGAHRAIEMMQEADNGSVEQAAPAAPVGAETHPLTTSPSQWPPRERWSAATQLSAGVPRPSGADGGSDRDVAERRRPGHLRPTPTPTRRRLGRGSLIYAARCCVA